MTTPDINAVVLPPLPEHDGSAEANMQGHSEGGYTCEYVSAWSESLVRAYATAAVLADRERRAPAAPVVAGTLRKALADLLTANAHNASCQAGIASNCICVACATERARAALSAPVGAAAPSDGAMRGDE